MQPPPGYIEHPVRPPPSARSRPPLPPIPTGGRPRTGTNGAASPWSSASSSSTNPFDEPLPNPFPEQDAATPITTTRNSGGGPPAYEYENNPYVYSPAVQTGGLLYAQVQRPRVKSMSEERRQWTGSPSTFGPATMSFPMPDFRPSLPPLPNHLSQNQAPSPSQVRPQPPPPPPPPKLTTGPPPPPPPPPPRLQPQRNPSVPNITTHFNSVRLNDDSSPSPPPPSSLTRATTASATASPDYARNRIPGTNSRSNSDTSAVSAVTPLRRQPMGTHKSDQGPPGAFHPNLLQLQHNAPSVASLQSTNTYSRDPDQFQDALSSPVESAFSFENEEAKAFAKLSNLSEDMSDSIRRFQAGELSEADEEWHRLVPEEALKALEETEIARQSMLFEFFKAERDYVSDLELMHTVVVRGLLEANPPVIPTHQVMGFVNDVFGNMHEILAHHKSMLDALFLRQREDHPLVHSIADIVLETALKPEFRDAYEKYIKHYPVADSIHQKQQQTNMAYAAFLESVSTNPKIKKRDLKIFLSRPVTRLPRLNLLLESMLKRTNKEHDHPDLETLPIVLGILGDCIKATQPGIEAAESKVKFLDIIEHMEPLKGEIMDMDLFDKERHLVYAGPIFIKSKTDYKGFSTEKWNEYQGILLDNYFIICREHRLNGTVVKRLIHSRPIPLSFIRIASFDGAPDIRKEKGDEGGLLDTFRTREIPMYAFTFYHASPSSMKAYKLYVTSDAQRKKWQASFVDALGVHKVKQENNYWYAQEQRSDGFFRIPREAVITPNSRATGKLVGAVPFWTTSGRFIAVACNSGIYVGVYKSEEFQKVFNFPNAAYIAAIQSQTNPALNKFIIHYETTVLSYSLEIMAKMALGTANGSLLEASRELITPTDQNVMFARHIVIGERALLVYASKKRLSGSSQIHCLEAVLPTLQRGTNKPSSFRPFGQSGTIPKDAYDVVALTRTMAICTKDGLVTADPSNLANTSSPPVPVLNDASTNPATARLKAQIDPARPLGFLRVSHDEIMVVYDDLACYINTRGMPLRNGKYIKWETKATSYAYREPHLFLVSPRFIEIRNVGTGRLVQVIEGGDIRLLYSEPALKDASGKVNHNILVAMRGRYNDAGGLSEKIVELEATEELNAGGNMTSPMWTEWDM